MNPRVLLINPWIYDFAAYDLWSKPLGLLSLTGFLRSRGYEVHLIDCLDIHHPGMITGSGLTAPTRRAYGTGKFWREEVERPAPLSHVPRPFSRYGISPDLFVQALQRVESPSVVLVTSLMTYWYPGVQEAVAMVKQVHPNVPVLLGGVYARLCRAHAQSCSGADYVADTGDTFPMESLIHTLQRLGVPLPAHPPQNAPPPYPAFDLLRRPEYVCIATSWGCPYRCRYCASAYLQPSFIQRDPEEVLAEILYWHDHLRVRDVAFYDDALLVNADTHLNILLEKLLSRGLNVRFHTPNALHVRELTLDTARLLRQTGFRTIRLGLETSDPNLRGNLDNKVGEGDFERAVRLLGQAGFGRRDVGVYVLLGLPGQSVASVRKTLETVDRAGAVPYLAEYSPMPHTTLWDRAVQASSWDLSEPLYHNNTLIPCWNPDQRSRVAELRTHAKALRAPRAGEPKGFSTA
ncbi:MAG: radical SAM protein [Desulfobacteraceae bacterium]